MIGHMRARITAVLGDRDDAVRALVDAKASGFSADYADLHTNPDFDLLRGLPAFDALLKPEG
jgi:hypothetical protein